MQSPEIPESIRSRKGAVKTTGIPPEVQRLLNTGAIASVNLVEWMMVDHELLAENVLPPLGLGKALVPVRSRLAALKKRTAKQATEAVAAGLLDVVTGARERKSLEASLGAHASDTVRGWGAYVVGFDRETSIDEKLARIRPYAVDPHFGVRELGWLAVRPSVMDDLEWSIDILRSWVLDRDASARRFASELTRPCGVWCAHIARLKTEPEIALPLLDPLYSDPSKYVRDSVANWLNDASKTRGDWVRAVCDQWLAESPTPETAYIVKRALRTLRKGEMKG